MRFPGYRLLVCRGLGCIWLFLAAPVMAEQAMWVVTNTAASGRGSLAEAVEKANASPTGGAIAFRLPAGDSGYDAASGTWRLALSAPLPVVTREGVTIDAGAQKGRIVLQAGREGVEYALTLAASRCRVRGLAIRGFRHGLVIYGAGARENLVRENELGPGNETGVAVVDGAAENTLAENVISGNRSIGVYLGGRETCDNTLRDNRIGCDAGGTTRVPNAIGVMLARASRNLLVGNTISGNDDIGLLMVGKWTERNRIEGNFIGVDPGGRRLLHNDKGIVIKSLANNNRIGGDGAGRRNIISGNIEIGIYIEAADGNVIQGNYIGTDITGRVAVVDGEKVQGNGIEFNTCAKGNVLGGRAESERNIISGHKVYGVVYYGNCRQNSTIGNYIGTDVSGERALPNATGICVDCASHDNDIALNVISGNLNYGMFFVTRGTRGNTLRGNFIGTNAGGDRPVPNDIGMVISTGAADNLVGGPRPEDRNLISGNRQAGLMITNRFTESNRIEGNYIGVDIGGGNRLGNRHGVVLSTYPAGNVLRNNVISGNQDTGVVICEYARGNELLGNRIGTDAAGAKIIGNGAASVVIDASARDNLLERMEADNRLAPAGVLWLPNAKAPVPASGSSHGKGPGEPLASPTERLTIPTIIANEPDTLIAVVVTNTRDRGAGSLREAIERCNRVGGRVRVRFEIPDMDPGFDRTTGQWTIQLAEMLPPITASHLLIDGRRIVLSGSGHSIECAFLILNASNVVIRGFTIREFLYGVQIHGAKARGNRIAGSQLVNNFNAIEILSGAGGNVVGGTTEADRNIIVGNQHIGIRISDADGNRVCGNYVGVDQSGRKAKPNYDGICIEGRSRNNLIGGRSTGERNIASGNIAYGIDLFGAGVKENIVIGNFIGTDATGTAPVPNTYGVLFDDRAAGNILGGLGEGEWNLISGNTAFGAYIYNNGTRGNIVRGNRIGTDVACTYAIPNETGVHIDGGAVSNLVEHNLVSGNLVAGITIFALNTDRNVIRANRIGVGVDGRPLGNGSDGIRIVLGPRGNVLGGTRQENLIANNGGCGIAVEPAERRGNAILENVFRSNRGPDVGAQSEATR